MSNFIKKLIRFRTIVLISMLPLLIAALFATFRGIHMKKVNEALEEHEMEAMRAGYSNILHTNIKKLENIHIGNREFYYIETSESSNVKTERNKYFLSKVLTRFYDDIKEGDNIIIYKKALPASTFERQILKEEIVDSSVIYGIAIDNSTMALRYFLQSLFFVGLAGIFASGILFFTSGINKHRLKKYYNYDYREYYNQRVHITPRGKHLKQ